jgi:hypothetical protein
MFDLEFTFTAECWMWQGKGAWVFITLPVDKSEEIKFFSENIHGKRRGWGAVRVTASIGTTVWQTSIFPDSKRGAYLLPLKLDVRKKEKIAVDDNVKVSIKISM